MNKTSTSLKRVESLDGFRGITSFLIMTTHYLLYNPLICKAENLPLLSDGFSWKLPYFFILSGFLLTLSWQKMKSQNRPNMYKNFMINRFFRIYPVFFISTIAVFFIKWFFDAGQNISEASSYFNIAWRIEGSFSQLLNLLTLVGFGNTWTFNGPSWTLVFDMRFALILPLLIWLFSRNWGFIFIFFILSALAYHINGQIGTIDLFYSKNIQLSGICSMFSFLFFHTAGICLALNKDKIFSFYKSLSKAKSVIIIIIAIGLMIAPVWTKYFIPASFSSITTNTLILIGTSMWIVILSNNIYISKIFSLPIIVLMGRSSFSIYLWHAPVFLLLYLLLYQYINIWYIIVLSIITTLIIAQLSFKYIEKPFISLGKKISSRNK